MSSEKKHVSLVICGHVDAGKSTTTGRLIFELGGIDQRTMDKLKAEADALGKGSFAFAFFMDKSKEERARGVTIACTTKEFYTESYHYTIIDAPGHRDFIKNMISGASQADVAMLMVPSDGNFTTALQKGNHKKGQVQGQSRQHAQLIKLLGVKQLIVGVNKMDCKVASYKKERYEEIAAEVKNVLKKLGWRNIAQCPIMPLSGYVGDNLITKSDNMKWWKGMEVTDLNGKKLTVVTLLDCLEKYVVLPDRNKTLKVRMPVSGVYKIPGIGDVITGRVEQGVVNVKDKVNFYPSHGKVPCSGVINSVEMHHKKVPAAYAGDNVGLNVKGLTKENMPKIGDILVNDKDGHLPAAETFTAKVQVLQVPNPVKVGYSPIGFVRTNRSACKIVEIIDTVETVKTKGSKKATKIKIESPMELKANSVATIVFAPQQMMCVEPAKVCEGLGRLALMEGNGLVMMGNIIKVTHKDTFKAAK